MSRPTKNAEADKRKNYTDGEAFPASPVLLCARLSSLSDPVWPKVLSADGQTRTYVVHGQLFFVSTEAFLKAFDWKDSAKSIIIDLTHSHLWDSSAVGAIDKVVLKARRLGMAAEIIGMNHASETILESLAVHHKVGANGVLTGH